MRKNVIKIISTMMVLSLLLPSVTPGVRAVIDEVSFDVNTPSRPTIWSYVPYLDATFDMLENGNNEVNIHESSEIQQMYIEPESIEALSYAGTSNGYTYSVSGNNAVITMYNGTDSVVTVPETIDGYIVTEVANSSFKDNLYIESLSFENTQIKVIGNYAFSGCMNLTTLILPPFVEEIGFGMVINTRISSITIPRTIKRAGVITSYGAFTGTYDSFLQEVYFEDGITEIPRNILSYAESVTDVIIPNSVTSIGASAFSNTDSLVNVNSGNGETGVIIPKGVTKIPQGAFYFAKSITNVTIPDSVTSIGSYAFGNAVSLANIIIPDSVTSIGNYALGNTAWLKAQADGVVYAGNVAYEYKGTMPRETFIILKKGTVGVAEYAFYNNQNLKCVDIPKGVESIGDYAFAWCSELTIAAISNSVKSIGSSAFYGCNSNFAIYGISGSYAETYANEKGIEFVVNYVPKSYDVSVINGTGEGSYVEDSTVTVIANASPEGKHFKKWVTTPAVTFTNGTNAKYSTASFIMPTTSVVMTAVYDNPTEDYLYEMYYDEGSNEVKTEIYEYIGKYSNVILPETIDGKPVTWIAYSAFQSCPYVTNIFIPDSVTWIGENAFYGCSDDLTIYCNPGSYAEAYAKENGIPFSTDSPPEPIPEGLIYQISYDDNIEITGYSGTDAVITIPSTIDGTAVTSIGNNAFSGCTGLTSITIPDSIKIIGINAFSGCTGLTSITIPDSVTSIGNSTFSGCTGLTSITIPNSVTNIAENAFYGCTGLTNIKIPDNVKSIENSTFSGCTGLTSITIPNGVAGIGNSAFYGCTGLTSITIPNSVTSIESSAFSGCTGLTSIAIPDSVTSIGVAAFSGCTDLEEIIVGSGNTGFVNENGVLYDKNKTRLLLYLNKKTDASFSIPDTVEIIDGGAFGKNTYIETIIFPKSVDMINGSAFHACQNLTGIYVDSDNASFTDVDGILFSKDMTTLFCYPAGKPEHTYVIPETVERLGWSSFNGSIYLTDITIPKNVKIIDGFAFYDCKEMQNVVILDGVTTINMIAFGSCSNLISITIPGSVTMIDFGAFNDSPNVIINGYNGSYAENYAKTNSIPFVASNIPNSTITEALETETPVIANETNGTVITADALETVKDSGRPLTILLESSKSAIGDIKLTLNFDDSDGSETVELKDFNLDLSVSVTEEKIMHQNIAIPEKSMVLAPEEKGDFGFSIVIEIPISEFEKIGADLDNLKLYYISDKGEISEIDGLSVDKTNNVLTVTINNASSYVVSEKPPIIIPPYGDVNCDGEINQIDVTALKRYLAGWPISLFDSNRADVNADKKINDIDIIILKRYLAEWSVTLGGN